MLLRELGLAYVVLVGFLLIGNSLLRFLGLDQEAVSIAGGIVLFLIALRMIFPGQGSLTEAASTASRSSCRWPSPGGRARRRWPRCCCSTARCRSTLTLLMVVTLAWPLGGVILLSSTFLYRVLGERGLVAMERLMGMLLVMVAVQMLMDGIAAFLQRH